MSRVANFSIRCLCNVVNSTACGSGSSSRLLKSVPFHQRTVPEPRDQKLIPSSSRTITTAFKDRPELQLTLALIKPSVCAYQPDVSAILKEIKQSGLNVARSKRLFWTSQEAHEFYAEHRGRFYYDRLILGMISGPSLALALYGPDAIQKWRSMLGPTKAYKSKWQHPACLRARYGLGDTRNGFHGSDSDHSAIRELSLVFDGWDTQWWLDREQGKLPVDDGGKLNPLGF
ncbi:related to Nucleoside diphosphate kinase 6 [Melanopsichium pennsylvanicum]|uniref:Nucleoside diphosphate kinase n=2 Tax=Melanopsichium pennsylvanicum TaxID=63383 RepID=A0AAJ4XNS7_9BASI|nr:related to Nucleoside diphosphate kinase 6 [Melanopsichium pennsylvanicum 4]SNX85744.1 related to Nucleoside diphosphate kinase 6 [Melanopsichium pennsylvanicum]